MYRKNQGSQNIGFLLVSATTGAALTGATVTVYRSIDGGAQASATGAVSEKGNGQYNLALSQADTNGNQISLLFTATGAIPVEKTIVTTAADPTDATRLGLSALPNAAANANGGLPVLSVSGTTLAYTVSTLTTYTGNTPQTGDSYAVVNNGTYGNSALHTQIGSPWQVGTKYAVTLAAADVSGNVPADLQTVKTQAVTCSASVTVLASVGTAATSTAQTGDSYALANGASGFAAIKGDTAALRADLDNNTNGVGAIYAIVSSGTYGNAALHTQVGSPMQAGNVTVGGYAAGQDPATLVLDVSASGHNAAGTIGARINAAGAAGDPLAAAVPGAYAAGSAGYVLGNLAAAPVSVVSPVLQGGLLLTLVAGDDYRAADGRQLAFTGPAWALGASDALAIHFAGPAGEVLSAAGTRVDGQHCYFELTAAQTALLRAAQRYGIVQTTAAPAGHVLTLLVEGPLQVLPPASA